MAKTTVEIFVQGLQQMRNDFTQMARPESYERGARALDDVLRTGFEATQLAVPTDSGDYRRPAGALRDSGRYRGEFDGDHWSGEVSYGTEDDALPYAAWVRYRNLHKTGRDYLGDPMNDMTEEFDQAVNAPFDNVWGPET